MTLIIYLLVRLLLETYMSFLDDSRTPNAFGWACWFVLCKPAGWPLCGSPIAATTHREPAMH